MISNYKTSKICPVCGSKENVYRSRARNRIERVINKTKLLSMYRCHECNWRGIRLRKIKFEIKISQIIKFILILLFTYYAILYVLKQSFRLVFFK